MKRLVIDLDNTITSGDGDRSYENQIPNHEVIQRIRDYKSKGFEIVIYSSRNMRTYGGSVGKINANTLPVIIEWLKRHDVDYDEIWVGKPWCGTEGFYVDDRAVRPSEFVELDYHEVMALISPAVSAS